MSVIIEKLVLVVIFTGLSCQTARSEIVYVCEGEGEGGSILYSEKPCKSTKGVTLHFPDSYSVGEGLSDLEKRNLSAIEAREREEKESGLAPVETEDTTLAESKPVDEEECDKAKADLKQWEKVMSLGYLPEKKEYYYGELQKRIRTRDDACGLDGK